MGFCIIPFEFTSSHTISWQSDMCSPMGFDLSHEQKKNHGTNKLYASNKNPWMAQIKFHGTK